MKIFYRSLFACGCALLLGGLAVLVGSPSLAGKKKHDEPKVIAEPKVIPETRPDKSLVFVCWVPPFPPILGKETPIFLDDILLGGGVVSETCTYDYASQ